MGRGRDRAPALDLRPSYEEDLERWALERSGLVRLKRIALVLGLWLFLSAATIRVPEDQPDIKTALQYGPVSAAMMIHENFMGYTGGQPPYRSQPLISGYLFLKCAHLSQVFD